MVCYDLSSVWVLLCLPDLNLSKVLRDGSGCREGGGHPQNRSLSLAWSQT